MKNKIKPIDTSADSRAIPPEFLGPILKGRNTLKVASVLVIIFYSIGILLFGLYAVLLLSLWGEGIGKVVLLLLLFGLICGVGLTAGILGIQAGRQPKKAMVCLILGGILLLYYGLSFIWGITILMSQSSFSILLFVPSLVLTAVYFDGAYRYDKYYRDYLAQTQDEEEAF